VLLLFEKNKLCRCDPPRAREITISHLGIRNSIIRLPLLLFARNFAPSFLAPPSPEVKGPFARCANFFFPRRFPHTRRTHSFFFFVRLLRAIDRLLREKSGREARDTKKGKKGRLFARARERARLREREKEREREREDESKLDLSAFCVKNERGVYLQTSLWRFKEYISF
jgi:hypothetical protein